MPLGAALASFALLLLCDKVSARKRRRRRHQSKLRREESQLLINPTESIADVNAQKYKTYGSLD